MLGGKGEYAYVERLGHCFLICESDHFGFFVGGMFFVVGVRIFLVGLSVGRGLFK